MPTLAEIYKEHYKKTAPSVFASKKTNTKFRENNNLLACDLGLFFSQQPWTASWFSSEKPEDLFAEYVREIVSCAKQSAFVDRKGITHEFSKAEMTKILTLLADYIKQDPKLKVFLKAFSGVQNYIATPIDFKELFGIKPPKTSEVQANDNDEDVSVTETTSLVRRAGR